ncbi:MAG: methylated-DNA--[protein]-cysteine S-methyltransferase [Polyangiales bacterium]
MTMHHATFSSPLGVLHVYATDVGVCAIQPLDGRMQAEPHVLRHFAGQARASGDPFAAAGKLARYFGGELDALDDLPLDLQGTPFQLDVWAALRTIPVGTTTSYGALAHALGRPQASRAVGMANGKNPVMIVVPCHRVIGASGALTGYAGGLERKAWLLRHERAEPLQLSVEGCAIL